MNVYIVECHLNMVGAAPSINSINGDNSHYKGVSLSSAQTTQCMFDEPECLCYITMMAFIKRLDIDSLLSNGMTFLFNDPHEDILTHPYMNYDEHQIWNRGVSQRA